MIHKTAIVDPKSKISSNVDVGAYSVIGPNVEIGENTIVGAGSLVTKSIPSNVIAYGSPAKIIKSNPI